MRCALACSMLLLAACEQVVMANQRAITVEYDPTYGGLGRAADLALAHCQRGGKLPVPIGGPRENGRLRGLYVQSWECR